MRSKLIIILCMLLSVFSFSAFKSEIAKTEKINPSFLNEILDSDEQVPVIIELRDWPVSVFYSHFKTRYQKDPTEINYMIADQYAMQYRNTLKEKQKKVLDELQKKFELESQFEYTEVLNGFSCHINGKDISAILELRNIWRVSDARLELELFRKNASVSTGVYEVWQGKTGNKLSGKGVTIGIIDSGIDASHPEFKDKIKGGEDFSGEGNYQIDANFHGTHVAGIAAGLGQNNDSKGMAFNADLMVYKVSSSTRPGISMEYIFKAIDQSVKDKCKVINLSLGHIGGGENSKGDTAIYRAVKNANKAGVFVVAAIGNSGSRSKNIPWVAGSPAIIEDAFSVAASNDRQSSRLEISSFTSMGISPDAVFKPEISAPGVDIHSPIPRKFGSYYALSGTSMASPVIAGIVALMKEAQPSWSHDQIKSSLMNNAELIINPLNKFPVSFTLQGAGQARIDRALKTQAFIEPRALVIENWLQGYSGEIEVISNQANLSMPISLELFIENHEKLPFTIEIEPKNLELRQGEKAKVKIQIQPLQTPFDGVQRARYEGLIRLGAMHVPIMAYMETVVKENNSAIQQAVSDIQVSSARMNLASSQPMNMMQVVFSLNTGQEQTFEDQTTNSNYGSAKVFLSDPHGMEWSRKPVFELNNAVAGYYSFLWDGILEGEEAIPSGNFCFKVVANSKTEDEARSPIFNIHNEEYVPVAEPTISCTRMTVSGEYATLDVFWDLFQSPVNQMEMTLNFDDRRVEDMEVIFRDNPYTPANPMIRRNYIKLEWEGRWKNEHQHQRYHVASIRFKTKGIGTVTFSARCFVKNSQNRLIRVYPFLPELNLSRRSFLLADFNQDSKVDVLDLSLFSRHFDTIIRPDSVNFVYDLNQDRRIDEKDLDILHKEFGSQI